MRSKILNILSSALLICLPCHPIAAQTIAEKKAGMVEGTSELSPELQKFLKDINKELKERREELKRYQDQVVELYRNHAPPESYRDLLAKVREARENIRILQESWREMATKPEKHHEGYALWHQPETTLERLIMDYGALDYVYLIPPEIGGVEISIASNIPIPLSSWGEMLEQILLQSGVGIKELNPYLRTLYWIQDDFSKLRLITGNPNDLEIYPSDARIGFVLTPDPLDVKRVWYFLEKFSGPTTIMQRVGRVILIVGEVNAVKDLLKIYHFISVNKKELEYKAVPLNRVDAEEMARILNVVFHELVEEAPVEEQENAQPRAAPRRSSEISEANVLNVIALPKVARAVFLIGTKEEIDRAEAIIREVEGQVGGARDRSIFWYNVKHSDPEELAQIMEKIYYMMVENRVGYEQSREAKDRENELRAAVQEEIRTQRDRERGSRERPQTPQPYFFAPPYYEQGAYVVNPTPVGPKEMQQKEPNKGRDNFIVDPKTGSLVMVIETDLIPKLEEVMVKLDTPKKMVQIEVMLFERAMRRRNAYGLNILKLGDAASKENLSASAFHGDGATGLANALIDKFSPVVGRGIFEFLYTRENVPIDLAYKFMMTQDNVSLNASPSVVTMNQTEATIAIKDERSILVGSVFPESNTGVAAQNAYSRAQYGIQITVTPTVHMAEKRGYYADPKNYVTLVSHINFDTFPPGQEVSSQPNVSRREIINEVRIPDGQTVILGGLRRKQTEDTVERIPFLGEIPGLGKLFSHTALTDEDVELIIFMTPKIISEPSEEFQRLRTESLCRRPGDLPAFMYSLNEALDREKERLFQGYMTMICGRPKPRYVCEGAEYDGR